MKLEINNNIYIECQIFRNSKTWGKFKPRLDSIKYSTMLQTRLASIVGNNVNSGFKLVMLFTCAWDALPCIETYLE